jgi:hypothetical protein
MTTDERIKWWQALKTLRWLKFDYDLNGPSQIGACVECWAAVWRVELDAHRAWHEAQR